MSHTLDTLDTTDTLDTPGTGATQDALPLDLDTAAPDTTWWDPMTFHVPQPGQRIYDQVSSPIGTITLVGDGTSLTGLYMGPEEERVDAWRRVPGAFDEVTEQLVAYFAGELRTFTVSLAPEGTEFQRGVWQALTQLPYGQTTSYGELAKSLGKPGASRAVGLANGRNPISIVVPCHRVIGADGSLTGYGGGLPRKRHLLSLEGAKFRG